MKKNKKMKKPTPEVTEAQKPSEVSESTASAKKRRFSRRTLIKVMFVISVIFIMISLTYSWFTSSNNASVKGAELSVVDPNNLNAEGVKAKGQVNSVAGDGTVFFKPQLERQLVSSTESGYNLYKDALKKDENGVGLYERLDKDDVISEEATVSNVLVKDFTLKITGKHKLNMMKGSNVSATEEVNPALRMVLLKLDTVEKKYEPLFVWIPYSEAVTVVYPDSEDKVDGANEKSLSKEDSEFGSVKYYWGEIGETPISAGEINEEGKYRVVVWLDGNDEASDDYSALGQTVSVSLKFLPEAISEEATDEDAQTTNE